MASWIKHLFSNRICHRYRVWDVGVRVTIYKEQRNATVENRLNLNVRGLPFEYVVFWIEIIIKCSSIVCCTWCLFCTVWWYLVFFPACQKIVGTRLSASSQCLSGGSRPVTPQPLVNSPSHNHSTFLYKVRTILFNLKAKVIIRFIETHV